MTTTTPRKLHSLRLTDQELVLLLCALDDYAAGFAGVVPHYAEDAKLLARQLTQLRNDWLHPQVGGTR